MTLLVTPNVSLAPTSDRMGTLLMTLRDLLVASGLWKVRGSGDGRKPSSWPYTPGDNLLWEGRTAPGPGGKFDVFSAPPSAVMSVADFGVLYKPHSITNPSAWLVLQEVGSTRSWLFARSYGVGTQSETVWNVEFCPGGYDGSNATAWIPPVPIGPSKAFAGSTRNAPAANNAPYFPFSQGSQDLTEQYYYYSHGQATSTSSVRVHFWTATAPGEKGVCPFGYYMVETGTPAEVGGLFYESLSGSPSTEIHPCMASLRNASLFGRDLWANESWCGGASLSPVYGEQLGGPSLWVAPPATRQTDPDGKWRTFRPRIYWLDQGVYRFVGRADHLVANLVNRAYPTTYGVATDTPSVTIGKMLFPWKKTVAPAWGP